MDTTFTRFKTANELKLIIQGEISDDINMDRVALYFEEFAGSLKGLQVLLERKK